MPSDTVKKLMSTINQNQIAEEVELENTAHLYFTQNKHIEFEALQDGSLHVVVKGIVPMTEYDGDMFNPEFVSHLIEQGIPEEIFEDIRQSIFDKVNNYKLINHFIRASRT